MGVYKNGELVEAPDWPFLGLFFYSDEACTIPTNCWMYVYGAKMEYSLDNGVTWYSTLYPYSDVNTVGEVCIEWGRIFLRCTGRTKAPAPLFEHDYMGEKVLYIKALGNICALLDYQNPPMTLEANAFSDPYLGSLFRGNRLVTAPSMPATTIASNSYTGLYRGQSYLKYVPVSSKWFEGKPAQAGMFEGCTNIEGKTPYSQIPAGWK
jgi:hypothetical protein